MLGATLNLPSYLDRLNREVARLNQADIQKWADLVYDAWKNGRFVFIFGNGLLRPEDLKDESKQRLKVLSLTDNAGWIMAVGNDVAYDQIFLQQLMNYGSKGDL